MPTLQGWTNTDFSRAAYSTTARHLSQIENNAMRNFALLSLLEAGDRIETGVSGRGMSWRVKYRNHDVQGNRGEGPRTFTRKNLRIMAYLEFRGYQVTDIIFRKEMLENRGPEALIRIMDNFRDDLTDSLQQHLGRQVYVDGYATGNEDTWHGLESMFGISAGNTLAANGSGSQSRSQADILAVPDDSYAGLDTDLGAQGGSQESSVMWPLGSADPEYDCWSPLVLIYDTTYYDTPLGITADKDSLAEVLRFGIINAARNATMDQQITQIILDRALYQLLSSVYAGKERLNIQKGEGAASLSSIGFKNVLNFDGVEVTWDAAVSTNRGYGLNINGIDMKSMESEGLFHLDDVEYDMTDQGFRVALSTLSNLRFKSGPRNMFKVIPYAATA